MEASLTYVPMAVRFKLDKCGIKLSLAHWSQLPERERRKLLKAPCANSSDIASYDSSRSRR